MYNLQRHPGSSRFIANRPSYSTHYYIQRALVANQTSTPNGQEEMKYGRQC